ncbi:MAG: hypothetical protein JRJ12_01770 [Deltaproteobacteria bacterium]|nr:hypothetical protein [Deltaproteobacteria bacterium]MBW2069905.1 hypothetical protein [Deltaproteobacteria bacterium]
MGTLKVENFPDELSQEAESRAALEGITLQELVIQAVTNYVKSPLTLDVQEVIVKSKEQEAD